MKRRLLAMVLSLAMLMGLLPTAALAAGSGGPSGGAPYQDLGQREEGAVSAEKFTISEMSAPATNDFSPAPVRITTLMSSLPSISVRTSFNSVSVSLFRAFNAFGLLIVSTAIGPSTSKSKLFISNTSCFGKCTVRIFLNKFRILHLKELERTCNLCILRIQFTQQIDYTPYLLKRKQ